MTLQLFQYLYSHFYIVIYTYLSLYLSLSIYIYSDSSNFYISILLYVVYYYASIIDTYTLICSSFVFPFYIGLAMPQGAALSATYVIIFFMLGGCTLVIRFFSLVSYTICRSSCFFFKSASRCLRGERVE